LKTKITQIVRFANAIERSEQSVQIIFLFNL